MSEELIKSDFIDNLREQDRKRPNPYNIIAQLGGQENALNCDSDIVIMGGNRGGSKGQPYDSLVVTPFGLRKMGDLEVGSIISDTEGGEQEVIHITELGVKPVYTLFFSDHTSCICTEDHLWKIKSGKWRLADTIEVMRLIDKGFHVHIPICDEVNFDESIGNKPAENIYYLGRFMAKRYMECGSKGHKAFDRIPDRIKFGPSKRRWAFVKGMMDEAGYSERNGRCIFNTTRTWLASDFAFLMRSLGFFANVEGSIARPKVVIEGNGMYRLFRDGKKVSRCWDKQNSHKEMTKRIIGYVDSGHEPCRCIAVSNPNALYMTNDFIVTHNSFSLLLESLYDVNDRFFSATVLRNEKDDLYSIIAQSDQVYAQFGQYNRSINDMTWNFIHGGKLKFSYYSDSFEDFKKRFQGKEFSYIAIDEITHCTFDKFKYLITCNRNSHGIKNRFWGTCNPDPDSWVRIFIDWWIGEDGYPIPDRDGVERYCFMDGDGPESIVWGSTREEVYAQCKGIIDGLWKEKYEELGFDKLKMFIKSVTFIRARLEDNLKLISSDPNYVSNLAQQDEESRARDLEGNWNFRNSGDDMIKMEDMERMFRSTEQSEPNIRYASCDIAFTGGDSLVMWLWRGWHIQDVFVCRADSRQSVAMVRQKLSEWGVMETNFCYDLNGLGQMFKGFFPHAVEFNNMGSPIDVNSSDSSAIRNMYGNLKSQAAYLFAMRIKEGRVSIEDSLLDRKFSGDGFENLPLRQILQRERKCVRANVDTADKGFSLIKKSMMKKYVGHSPDYFEALIMREIFELKQQYKAPTGLWMIM